MVSAKKTGRSRRGHRATRKIAGTTACSSRCQRLGCVDVELLLLSSINIRKACSSQGGVRTRVFVPRCLALAVRLDLPLLEEVVPCEKTKTPKQAAGTRYIYIFFSSTTMQTEKEQGEKEGPDCARLANTLGITQRNGTFSIRDLNDPVEN